MANIIFPNTSDNISILESYGTVYKYVNRAGAEVCRVAGNRYVFRHQAGSAINAYDRVFDTDGHYTPEQLSYHMLYRALLNCVCAVEIERLLGGRSTAARRGIK